MRKLKRKYIRKPKPDALESISSPTKEESSIIPQANKVKGFTFDDLPFSLRMQVESAIKMRKRLGLPDDSKERREITIRNFRGDRPR